MWGVARGTALCGIVGLHHGWNILLPVALVIFAQRPQHPHESAVKTFRGRVSHGVEWSGARLSDVGETAQLFDHTALEIMALIRMELFWKRVMNYELFI